MSDTHLVPDLYCSIGLAYPLGTRKQMLCLEALISNHTDQNIGIIGWRYLLMKIPLKVAKVQAYCRCKDLLKASPVFRIVAFYPFEGNVAYFEII